MNERLHKPLTGNTPARKTSSSVGFDPVKGGQGGLPLPSQGFFNNPSPVGIDPDSSLSFGAAFPRNSPHLPAFAALPRTGDSGMVGTARRGRAAARGSDSLRMGRRRWFGSLRPEPNRGERRLFHGKKRCGEREGGESPAAVSGPPVPAWSDRPDRSGLSNARREEALMDARTAKEMKIMIYPVNIDKFTGFFDKFLKIISPANDCNQTGYHINLSVSHSDLAAKKVFRLSRICPQPPAFAHTPHRGRKPSFPNPVEPSFLNRVRPPDHPAP